MEPGLLALEGEVEHATIEAALDQIEAGAYPGWQVSYDDIAIETVRGNRRDVVGGLVTGLAEVDALLTRSNAQVPVRVWVIVLEQGTRRREVLKFRLISDEDEHPLWVRIRPDTSMPAAEDSRQ